MLALKPDCNHHYSRNRIHRQDGSYYDVVEATALDPGEVEFHKGISASRELKLDDVAQLRMLKALSRGIESPVALVWDAYGHYEATEPIDLQYQGTDLIYVSKNAHITQHLRDLVSSHNYVIYEGNLQVKTIKTEKDAKMQELLDMLYREGRIKLVQGDPFLPLEEVYANFDPMKDVVAVGNIGLPSLHGRGGNYPIVFNTSFFLFEEEDFISEFSLLGDAYSMQIREGVIESPPLFNRSALLFQAGGNVELRQVSLHDLKMQALGRTFDLSTFALNETGQPGKPALYTRFFGIEQESRTLTRTPQDAGKLEFVIIDRAIVGVKRGGETEIPHNGFVLSLPADGVEQTTFTNEVRYSFLDGSQYTAGIQCGPGLLRDGEIILTQQSLKQEEFFRKTVRDGRVTDYGVVPTDYAEDIDETRAARMAIGVDFNGCLRVLAVESVNRGMEEATGESSGATLSELALVLKNRGYKHALNLDGGGSANIQYYYGHLVKGADRRGLPGITYERLVPSVGVIRNGKR